MKVCFAVSNAVEEKGQNFIQGKEKKKKENNKKNPPQTNSEAPHLFYPHSLSLVSSAQKWQLHLNIQKETIKEWTLESRKMLSAYVTAGKTVPYKPQIAWDRRLPPAPLLNACPWRGVQGLSPGHLCTSEIQVMQFHISHYTQKPRVGQGTV